MQHHRLVVEPATEEWLKATLDSIALAAYPHAVRGIYARLSAEPRSKRASCGIASIHRQAGQYPFRG
jgi:hypothetical protein